VNNEGGLQDERGRKRGERANSEPHEEIVTINIEPASSQPKVRTYATKKGRITYPWVRSR
jgi:hypothetical protein